MTAAGSAKAQLPAGNSHSRPHRRSPEGTGNGLGSAAPPAAHTHPGLLGTASSPAPSQTLTLGLSGTPPFPRESPPAGHPQRGPPRLENGGLPGALEGQEAEARPGPLHPEAAPSHRLSEAPRPGPARPGPPSRAPPEGGKC